MAPVAHSRLGASSAARWMNCPGSVALLATLPKPPDSAYSLEGTAAHAWAEVVLSAHDRDFTGLVGQEITTEKGNTHVLTAEMAGYLQTYIDEFWKYADRPGAIWFVENRFALTDIDGECFGTNDAAVFVPHERTLYVLDLKYGAGVPVSARGNPQLRYYALGAWQKLRNEYDVEHVTMVIVQPRGPAASPVSSETISLLELLDWSFELAAAVQRTRAPGAPLVAGYWCRKSFCAAQAVCPALRDMAGLEARHGMVSITPPTAALPPADRKPSDMSADELAEALARADVLEGWIVAVREHATIEAMRGRPPTGFKMVQGEGRREWSPELAETEIAAKIKATGNAVDPWTRKLITAPQLEKEIGKPAFKKHFEPLIRRKPGVPTLARASDTRPEWRPDTSGMQSLKMDDNNG